MFVLLFYCRKGDSMELIKNNKGVILFYLLIVIGGLLLTIDNKRSMQNEEYDSLVAYNDIFN